MAFSFCAHKALHFPSRVSPWDQLIPPVEETAAQLAFTTWSSVNVVSTWQSTILKITPRTPLRRWPTSMALWIPATSQAESWPPSEQPALEGWGENSVPSSWGAAQPTPSPGPSPSSGQCPARGELIVIRRALCTTAPATAETKPLEHRNQTARLLAFSDSFVLSDPLGALGAYRASWGCRQSPQEVRAGHSHHGLHGELRKKLREGTVEDVGLLWGQPHAPSPWEESVGTRALDLSRYPLSVLRKPGPFSGRSISLNINF